MSEYRDEVHGPIFTGVLHSCPFCGGKPRQDVSFGEHRGRDAVAVDCSKCGARGPYRRTYAIAAKLWNRRSL